MQLDNSLLEQMLSDENLQKAKQQVIKNKGAAGIDNMEVKDLDKYLSENLEIIKEQIKARKYKPSAVKRVEIPKDSGGVRLLGIPTVTDRFIQQAITQVLSPIYEPMFSDNSYGFRPNRNCEMAVVKALVYMNKGFEWIVDIDLEKFFDNVNHDKLIALVRENVKNGEIVSLVMKYLKCGVIVNDEYKESIIGTPQGGNISPLLSNIILDVLDKELEKRALNFVRYADDVLILVGSEKAANRVIENVSRFIMDTLGLKVNVTKSKVSKPNNIKFLGFGFYYDYHCKQYKAIPHHVSITKLKEKLKKLSLRSWGVSFDYRLLKIKQLIIGWVNYFKIAKFKTIARQIDEHLRFRLRMCIWKMWKNISTRKRALIKLGLTKQKAWEYSNTRKSYARVAMSFILTTTISNDRLKKRGLTSMLDQYNFRHI